MATVEKVMMKTFFLLLTMSCAFQSFATLRTVEVASSSPYTDTEWTTNVPFRITRPTSVGRFDIQLSRSIVSNSVQIALGVDRNDDGILAPEETAFVLGRDADTVFVENTIDEVRHEEAHALHRRVTTDFIWRVFLTEQGTPTHLVAHNESNESIFVDWRTSPPKWLFDSSWNLARVTVRGSTAATVHVSLFVGANGGVLILR